MASCRSYHCQSSFECVSHHFESCYAYHAMQQYHTVSQLSMEVKRYAMITSRRPSWGASTVIANAVQPPYYNMGVN
jgi:hypothetical protein